MTDDEGVPGEDDDIVCRRCGEDSLYWQMVTTVDGLHDRSILFDSRTHRRHACPLIDLFVKGDPKC